MALSTHENSVGLSSTCIINGWLILLTVGAWKKKNPFFLKIGRVVDTDVTNKAYLHTRVTELSNRINYG